MDRHIFLIGMPGSGKSALGRRVANKLQLPYLDMDVYLTEVTGMDTAQLYQQFGEQAFRDAETRLLQELVGVTPGIISTGGGACLRPENQELMKNHGVIIFIDRPVEDIMSNFRAEKRPLLAQKSKEEVEALYSQRLPIYQGLADITMNNGNGFQNGLAALEEVVSRFC